MPAPTTTADFIDLVRRSGVLEEERIQAFESAIEVDANGEAPPTTVAQIMIREGLITPFQARQFLNGKWKRFLINGKYKLLELLGTGGMGAVYLCEHIFMRRKVALKVLPVEKMKDPSAVERFYREARAAAALDHQNIVHAYDIDQDDKMHFLVMEYVDGASLQQLIALNGKMDALRACHYIRQTAEGLQHAHEGGLIHRDIKPGNLILDRAGTIKILDLGLARFHDIKKENVAITERFDESAILGTADYLSPEQANNDAIDIRADIYSLGATFYFLLAGKAPFEDGTIPQKLIWHQTKQPTPITKVRPDVAPEISKIIEKMMAKQPGDRFQTPRDLADALAPYTQTPIGPPPEHEIPARSAAASAPASASSVIVPNSSGSGITRRSGIVQTRRANQSPDPSQSTPAPSMKPGAASGLQRATISERKSGPKRHLREEPALKDKLLANPALVIGSCAGGSLLLLGLIAAIFWPKPPQTRQTDLGPGPSASVPSKVAPHTTTVDRRTRVTPTKTANADEITVDQVKDYLDKKCTLTMRVMSTGKARTTDLYFLNSLENFSDEKNFSVLLSKAFTDALRARGIEDPLKHFKNKNIRVTGTVQLYNNKSYQIRVDLPEQLEELDP